MADSILHNGEWRVASGEWSGSNDECRLPHLHHRLFRPHGATSACSSHLPGTHEFSRWLSWRTQPI